MSSLIKKETVASSNSGHVSNNNKEHSPAPVSEHDLINVSSPPLNNGPLYPYLGLYSHLMSLPPTYPVNTGQSPVLPGLNPLMMQAHLALAAQASAYANLHPSAMMDRLKSQRFSPYHHVSSSHKTHASTTSPLSSDSKSAFQSVVPGPRQHVTTPTPSSPPPSPSSQTATTSLRVKTITPPCLSPDTSHSSSSPGDHPSSKDTISGMTDIKNIENMVNGLKGGHETKFGISHDHRRTLTESQ